MTSNTKQVAETRALLEIALDQIKRAEAAQGREAVEHALAAAWRVADAGLLLRSALEFEEIEGFGVTSPTGRGALLPRKIEATAADRAGLDAYWPRLNAELAERGLPEAGFGVARSCFKSGVSPEIAAAQIDAQA